jgi:sulfur carrier protein ThiS
MKVRLTFLGPIRRPWSESSRELDIESDTTIEGLLTGLGYTSEDMQRVALVVAGQRQRVTERLSDGDELRVVLLAGGG